MPRWMVEDKLNVEGDLDYHIHRSSSTLLRYPTFLSSNHKHQTNFSGHISNLDANFCPLYWPSFHCSVETVFDPEHVFDGAVLFDIRDSVLGACLTDRLTSISV